MAEYSFRVTFMRKSYNQFRDYAIMSDSLHNAYLELFKTFEKIEVHFDYKEVRIEYIGNMNIN